MSRLLLAACALLAGGLSPGAASAQERPVPEAQIVRMGGLVGDTLPLGLMLDTVAGMDPKWPFQDNPGVVSETQLACVRGQMGRTQLDALVLKRVRNYARTNAARMQDDMAMLEGPGAQLFSKIMVAGMASQAPSIQSPSADELIAQARPADFAAMYQLFGDAQYTALRELLGFPSSMDMSQGEASGRALGATFMVPMLMDAFGACDVPLSVLSGGGASQDAGKNKAGSGR